jgi:hypothetical protein
MTQRKPAGIPMGNWIDAQIMQAQQSGQFDNLDTSVDPFAGLDEPYDPDWWLKKLIHREHLNAAPEMLLLKREVEVFRLALPGITSEEEVRSRAQAFNARIEVVNLTNSAPLSDDLSAMDVDRLVEHWRQSRLSRR